MFCMKCLPLRPVSVTKLSIILSKPTARSVLMLLFHSLGFVNVDVSFSSFLSYVHIYAK
jgi:hypothetical protein